MISGTIQDEFHTQTENCG